MRKLHPPGCSRSAKRDGRVRASSWCNRLISTVDVWIARDPEAAERLAFLVRVIHMPTLVVTDPGKGGQRAISSAAINSPGSCRRLLLSKAVNTFWCGARPIPFPVSPPLARS